MLIQWYRTLGHSKKRNHFWMMAGSSARIELCRYRAIIDYDNNVQIDASHYRAILLPDATLLKQLKQLRKGKLSEVPVTSGIENSEYSNMLWGVTYRYHWCRCWQCKLSCPTWNKLSCRCTSASCRYTQLLKVPGTNFLHFWKTILGSIDIYNFIVCHRFTKSFNLTTR